MEIDSAFWVPPGMGSSNASNVKAMATTASVKKINRSTAANSILALGLCYVVLDLSRA
jgi:hypothetical protein